MLSTPKPLPPASLLSLADESTPIFDSLPDELKEAAYREVEVNGDAYKTFLNQLWKSIEQSGLRALRDDC